MFPRAAAGRSPGDRARARVVGGIVLVMLVLVVAIVLRMTTKRASGLLVAALAEDVGRMPPSVAGEGVEPARLEQLRLRWNRMRERVRRGEGSLESVADARRRLASAVKDGRIDPAELAGLEEATTGW